MTARSSWARAGWARESATGVSDSLVLAAPMDLVLTAPVPDVTSTPLVILAEPMDLALTAMEPTLVGGLIILAVPMDVVLSLPAPEFFTLKALGRIVVDPSQGWGFDLGARITLGAVEPDDGTGSTQTRYSETYPDPVIVDGRPT